MPAEHTKIVRGVYQRWAEGDFATTDVLDPSAVLVMHAGLPDTGSYVGLEEIAGYTRGFLEPWTQITIEAEDLTEAENSIVVNVLQRGTGTGSGASTELRYAHVWTLRAGKVIRLEAFREREDAARAAGLIDYPSTGSA